MALGIRGTSWYGGRGPQTREPCSTWVSESNKSISALRPSSRRHRALGVEALEYLRIVAREFVLLP